MVSSHCSGCSALFPQHSKSPSLDKQQRRQRTRRAKRSPVSKTHLITGLQQKAFVRRILRYLNDCWHAVQKTDLTLHGRVGLGDPADTGQIWAIIGPITAMLHNIRSAHIRIEPEFIDATLELESRGRIRLVPLQLCYLTLGLLLSPPILRGIRHMRGRA